MKTNKTNAVRTLMVASLAVVLLGACQKKEEADAGSAEKLGRKLDQAAAQGAVELHKMGEQAGKALEKAGEKLQGKAQEAKQEEKKSDSKQ